MKYILVTGGVISGIGKGIISSSLGAILKCCGIEVTAIKIDPYVNLDAGTFSPYEHGEVFVLDDGGEVDLDLGNYERFLDITLHRENNITTGKVYQKVIENERRGDYLGKTVQVVPHITDTIQEWVEKVSKVPVSDNNKIPGVCIIELGGTISDLESAMFLETFKQFQYRVNRENFCVVHVSPVLQPKTTGDHKTKPTQASIQELRKLGLNPDIIVCRSEKPIVDSVRQKISNFCHVATSQIISVPDLESIYDVPVLLERNGIAKYLSERLDLDKKPLLLPIEKYMKPWINLGKMKSHCKYDTLVAIVGKYTKLEDSYTSIVKALTHAGNKVGSKVVIKFIEASSLEKTTLSEQPAIYHNAWLNLCTADCVVIPGGFGPRGVEGKIEASRWCRENNKPFLGICLGFQAAVIEFARNILHLGDANSTEMCENTAHPVIIEMPEHNTGQIGGTMRLGRRLTLLRDTADKSKIRRLYGSTDRIYERYRHRFEVNPQYVEQFETNGMRFVGVDVDHKRMEIFELDQHPYYVGVQYHPEYQSRPMKPSPPFTGLILAAKDRLKTYLTRGCELSPDEQADSGEELGEEGILMVNHYASSNGTSSSASLEVIGN